MLNESVNEYIVRTQFIMGTSSPFNDFSLILLIGNKSVKVVINFYKDIYSLKLMFIFLKCYYKIFFQNSLSHYVFQILSLGNIISHNWVLHKEHKEFFCNSLFFLLKCFSFNAILSDIMSLIK